MLKNLLLYRMTLTNLMVLAVIITTLSQGWLQLVFKSDTSHLTYAIAGLYAIGVIGCFHRATKVSQALNLLKTKRSWSGEEKKEFQNDVAKMPIKNGYLHTITENLTSVGLAGTIIGLMIMFRGLNLDAPSFPDLVQHMGTAFMCALSGVTTTALMAFNVRMLDTATNLLIKDAG